MDTPFDFSAFEQMYKQINQFENQNEYKRTIHSAGNIEIEFTVSNQHLSSPGVAHGGTMAGLMDATLGLSALTAALVDGNLVSTVEFKVNYLKPILLNDVLVGKGNVMRKGKTLIITRAEIYRNTEVVGLGQGTFNVYPMDKRDLI